MKLICTTNLNKISVAGLGDFKNGDSFEIDGALGCQLIKTINFKIVEPEKQKKKEKNKKE